MSREHAAKDFETEIANYIWNEKYRYLFPDGKPIDKCFDDTVDRIVGAICHKESSSYRERMHSFLMRRDFIPAGRIWAGAGTASRVTLMNCYVSPRIQDSMATDPDNEGVGIMDALRTAAFTQQMGGGIGMNFDVRPRDALVVRSNTTSSGNLPFMDMWNAMCATIQSSGSRRGAMMATMRIDHPDIEEFIDAKKTKGRLTNFNVSVLVTDEFLSAVKCDKDFDLVYPVPPYYAEERGTPVIERARPTGAGMIQTNMKCWIYKTVRARALWDKILRSTYEFAEPGVIFIDRVNAENNLQYCENITATNPCGEQPLPANGNCNLGAINLARMVSRPFETSAEIDFVKLRQVAHDATVFLDRVLDNCQYPLAEQAKEAQNKRRIGLGITGLGTMFQMLGVRYGDENSLRIIQHVMSGIRDSAYLTSCNMVRAGYSAFPLLSPQFNESPFIKRLPEDIRQKIRKYGIRNGVLLTIAPTGTISLLAENITSGCEPPFAWVFKRKVKQPDGSLREFLVEDYGYRAFRQRQGIELGGPVALPDHFVTTQELTVEDHLQVQSALQGFVDSSISKTINCPPDMTFEEFRRVYDRALELGCKGCTTYRPSGVRGAVLETLGVGGADEKTPPMASPSEESPGEGGEGGQTAPPSPRHTALDRLKNAGLGEGGEGGEGGEVSPLALPSLPVARPAQLSGMTYKKRWPASEYAFYITINDVQGVDGIVRPFEIFVNSRDATHTEWIAGLTRMISAVFRKGGDISFVAEELGQVHAASGGHFINKQYVPSVVALIGRTISEHMKLLGDLDEAESQLAKTSESQPVRTSESKPAETLEAKDSSFEPMDAGPGDDCPACHAPGWYVKSEGCQTCQICGHSNCG